MVKKKRRRPPPEAKILGGVFEGGKGVEDLYSYGRRRRPKKNNDDYVGRNVILDLKKLQNRRSVKPRS